jgi:hypothetical protein
MSSFNLTGNTNFPMHDESKKSLESCEKQLLLKNLASSKKANDIERYAFMLTQMLPISTIEKSEGIWLITYSSNLGKIICFNFDQKLTILIIFEKSL